MRGDNGQSRGFGFVSYQQPDQASSALQSMNAQMIRGKQIQVRFHEPKQLRQEKLAQRFSDGMNIGNRRTSGSSSPAISDAGELNSAFPERVRRGSGSYYNVSSCWFSFLAPYPHTVIRPLCQAASICLGVSTNCSLSPPSSGMMS